MGKIRYAWVWMLVALCAVACVYDYDPVVPGTSGVMVIEGDILIGGYTKVRISASSPLRGEMDESEGMKGGDIRFWVEAADGTRYGGYSPTIDTRLADPSQEYRLVVETGRGTYASAWVPVLRSAPIDSVAYSISDDRQTLTVDISAHGDADSPYYRWSAQENWEYHAPFQASFYYVRAGYDDREGELQLKDTVLQFKNGDNIYYCWNSDRIRDVLIASAESMPENRIVRHPLYAMNCFEQRISYLYSVEVTQEALSEQAYRYWETMMKNSGDVGGLFSPEPFEMRGNIYNTADSSEMVVGFINATVPSVQRIFINSEDLQFGKMPRGTYDIEPTFVDREFWRSYSRKGYLVYGLHTDGSPGTGREGPETYTFDWLPARCVDCVLWGSGNKNKPAFWPNDHK